MSSGRVRGQVALLIVLLAAVLVLVFGLRYYNGYFFFFDMPDRSGWIGEGSDRQYLDRHAGVVKDELLEIDGEKYYFDHSGFLHKGELELGGYVYLFDETTGAMQFGWVMKGGDRFYYDEDGRKIMDRVYSIDGSEFLFDKTGAEVIGPVTLDGKHYYFEAMTGMVKDGEKQVDGAWFYYTADGSRFGTGWLPLADGRIVYYDGDGGMLFGEQTIDGSPYLLNISMGGRMAGTVYFDGRVFQIAEDGVVQGYERTPLWHGIDVSVHQERIDWEAVAESGVQFAIVRAGYFASEGRQVFKPDDHYVQNIIGAQENGISVGAYIYLYNWTLEGMYEGLDAFHSYSEENRIKIDLPVFLDVEDKDYFKPGSDELGGYDYRTALVRDGMDYLRSLGYGAGFYTFLNWANREFDTGRLFQEGYPFWLANWYGNNEDLDPETLSWNGELQPSVWQFRATGQIPGIRKETDKNYLYWDRMH